MEANRVMKKGDNLIENYLFFCIGKIDFYLVSIYDFSVYNKVRLS